MIGDINADLTFVLPFLPKTGDDVPTEDLRWQSGGTGLNMAVALTRLGVHALLIGRIGSDPAAGVALRVAHESGVDLSALQQDRDHATGLCGVMVDPSAQRTFLSYRGANVFCDPELLPIPQIVTADLLIVGAHALLEDPQRRAALKAIEIAYASDVPVTLDLCIPAAQTARRSILSLLPQLHLICMNEEELRTLLPDYGISEAIDFLLRSGTAHVAIKRGAQGCSVACAEGRLDVLPPAVTTIDTNGCGDAFVAAYAVAIMRGADLSAAAALANLIGALTATRPGAADAVPSRAEISACLDHSLHYLIAG